jgi:hypothetical protein
MDLERRTSTLENENVMLTDTIKRLKRTVKELNARLKAAGLPTTTSDEHLASDAVVGATAASGGAMSTGATLSAAVAKAAAGAAMPALFAMNNNTAATEVVSPSPSLSSASSVDSHVGGVMATSTMPPPASIAMMDSSSTTTTTTTTVNNKSDPTTPFVMTASFSTAASHAPGVAVRSSVPAGVAAATAVGLQATSGGSSSIARQQQPSSSTTSLLLPTAVSDSVGSVFKRLLPPGCSPQPASSARSSEDAMGAGALRALAAGAGLGVGDVRTTVLGQTNAGAAANVSSTSASTQPVVDALSSLRANPLSSLMTL